jgi:adenylate kinase
MIILITGVPGTGKTTISKILARKLQAHHIDVSKLVFTENFVLRKDVMRNTLIADLETLKIKLKKLMTNNKKMIIDGHYSSDLIDAKLVKYIFVFRRAPWKLKGILLKRGYSSNKIWENLEAEILGISLSDALLYHDPKKICEIDTTYESQKKIVKRIMSIISGVKPCKFGEIDWINDSETQKLLKKNVTSLKTL